MEFAHASICVLCHVAIQYTIGAWMTVNTTTYAQMRALYFLFSGLMLS